MRKVILSIMVIGILVGGRCSKEDLQIGQQNYKGSDLRLDGLFYNEPQKAHFFLYRNGVFFDGGTGFNGSIDELKEFYSQKENYLTSYKLPYAWGVFIVERNKILIEKWVSNDAFGRYTTKKFDGVILNDTTLLLYHPANFIGIDTFYFQQFYSKPDSINDFIK